MVFLKTLDGHLLSQLARIPCLNTSLFHWPVLHQNKLELGNKPSMAASPESESPQHMIWALGKRFLTRSPGGMENACLTFWISCIETWFTYRAWNLEPRWEKPWFLSRASPSWAHIPILGPVEIQGQVQGSWGPETMQFWQILGAADAAGGEQPEQSRKWGPREDLASEDTIISMPRPAEDRLGPGESTVLGKPHAMPKTESEPDWPKLIWGQALTSMWGKDSPHSADRETEAKGS